jgi:hypothetical protein
VCVNHATNGSIRQESKAGMRADERKHLTMLFIYSTHFGSALRRLTYTFCFWDHFLRLFSGRGEGREREQKFLAYDDDLTGRANAVSEAARNVSADQNTTDGGVFRPFLSADLRSDVLLSSDETGDSQLTRPTLRWYARTSESTFHPM